MSPSYQCLPQLGESIRVIPKRAQGERQMRLLTMRKLLVATGMTSAIGRALHERLEKDWDVLSLSRRPADKGFWIPADLRSYPPGWVLPLTEWLRGHGRPVDALVHLAGAVFSDNTERVTPSEWVDQLHVNLSAAFWLGQAVYPWLASPGSVVLVGSVDSWHYGQNGPAPAYGAAKAGLVGLTRQWAGEWGRQGIRVNLVSPGALALGNGPQESSVAEAVAENTALGRLGRPEEVASVIEFLLGPGSSYMTGAILAVDGGLNISY